MKIKKNKILENPYLLFSPFFLLYIVLILLFATNVNHGDENRYLGYAHNLTHGFYSLPLPNLDLGNGPGYPIIITPFIALGFPLIFIKLLNALFYYLSIVFLYKSLRQIVPLKFSIIFSLFWALYPNTFEQMPYALTEVFASSLIPLLIFTVFNAFKKDNTRKIKRYIIFSGITFGYIALTKPIFGYVLIFMFIGILFLWIMKRTNINYKKSMIIFIIAFITTAPWLVYTYHMTGNAFYWSSFGGNNLYWMSSPYKNEYGDWIAYPYYTDGNSRIPGSEETIKLQHQKDFEQVLADKDWQKVYLRNGVVLGKPFAGVIQDEILKKIAFHNIETYPVKFIENCASNAGRIIFNYPASYTLQKPSTLLRLPVNGIILVFATICFIITLFNWKKIYFSIHFILFFGLLYFGGSLLGSATPRMFTVLVPVLLVWIAFIVHKSLKISLSFKNEA